MYKFLWLISIISCNSIAKNVEAPFGFKWGMSQESVEVKKVKLINCESGLNITGCEAKRAIKNVSFSDSYYLYFDNDMGLQKIKLVGKDIISDPTGSEGKALYERIKSGLIKKYSEPKIYEWIGDKIYTGDDEFYQCLKYEGCGFWSSVWNDLKGGVILDLHGLNRGHGFISLTYESRQWSDVMKKYKTNEKSSDEGAL